MKYLLTGEKSDRLLFRELKQDDFPAWLEFFKDPFSTKHWNFENKEPDILCQNWFDKIFYRYENDLGGMNVLIDKQSGDFIGQCGLLIQQVDGMEELEVGYSIMPDFAEKDMQPKLQKNALNSPLQKASQIH